MREFDVNGDIKSNTLAGPPSGTAGGELTGTYPNPTVISSGLVVKVPNTFADGIVVRNHTDDAWSVATSASILAAVYPVGSIYLAAVATDPATLLGFGTWAAYGVGQTLVAIDGADSDFDADAKTGGAKTVASAGTVAAPVFTGTVLGTHTHTVATHSSAVVGNSVGGDTGVATSFTHTPSSTSAGTPAGTNSAPAFTGSATSVVMPYIVCHVWKRTA